MLKCQIKSQNYKCQNVKLRTGFLGFLQFYLFIFIRKIHDVYATNVSFFASNVKKTVTSCRAFYVDKFLLFLLHKKGSVAPDNGSKSSFVAADEHWHSQLRITVNQINVSQSSDLMQ